MTKDELLQALKNDGKSDEDAVRITNYLSWDQDGNLFSSPLSKRELAWAEEVSRQLNDHHKNGGTTDTFVLDRSKRKEILGQ